MTPEDQPDRLPDALLNSVRAGDATAWRILIDRYEGRLLAFARRRLGNLETAEDVVQETLVGFLTSLPNFDDRKPVEGYLFTICGYKIADELRRRGRRPVLHSGRGDDSLDPVAQLTGGRVASSLARSQERKRWEERVIVDVISQTITRWKGRGDWTKLACIELLFVADAPNRQVAKKLGLTEQQVANYKSDFLGKLKSALAGRGVDDESLPVLR